MSAGIPGQTIDLADLTWEVRGSGRVATLDSLIAAAFVGGVAPENTGTTRGVSLYVLHADSTGLTFSVAGGRDALQDDGADPPVATTPNHSTIRVAPGDPGTVLGAFRRGGEGADYWYLVLTGGAPTAGQILVTPVVG